ncbi:MAG: AAA family ATPase [Actinobacteria bacterium]|nr:AAA family ATPase [Actinomycetota bacterium]
MQVCTVCGEENPERARFCLSCGHALVADARASEERKVVSVLFVDLVGFTDRSDRADPEDVRATLRPYHERVKADIERFGGTVEKFIGDAVMAVFGAPVAHEDDAERAVHSALRVLGTIDDLREEGVELAVRAAVSTGEAVVAIGAHPERGEGIVTGDVVNTAARLQASAAVGTAVVDEATMRSTEAAIAFEALEPVSAKGKKDPIPVWRAVHARSRVGQPEAATRTPFIGREHERRLLLETFLRAERESSVQLATVVGEPGIGKSRLVTEIRSALDDRPEIVTWRHGRCLPYGEGITFWALGEIVKAEAGILESDDQGEAASKLEEMVSTLFGDESDRAWFVSRLAPLVGAGGDGAAANREESFTAWRRFLEAIAARRSCVFVLEDLHWADAPLLEFLEELLDWSPPVPLLLLCTARPELFERSPSWGGGKRNATTISLSPLSTEEAAKLLHALLEKTLLPAETQAVLLERTGGNPLYAEQFARMLAERGGAADLAVPETVHALIAARLDTLSPELKALVQDASVVGRIFWSGSIAAIGRQERDEVRRSLNELVRREFVRPIRVSSLEGEDEFSFWHALVRDVAYQQIPRSPRAEKHLAAAAWVEDIADERLEDQAEILVYHYGQALELFEASGDRRPDVAERLVGFLLLAGDRATQLDTEAAEAYFRRALALSEHDEPARATALARLAPVLGERGEVAEGIEAADGAISIFREVDPHAAAVVMSNLATALWARGDLARTRELRVEAISILERAPGPDLVTVYGQSALTAAIAGRYEEAAVLLEKGLALAAELGVENVMSLLLARGTIQGHSGDPGCIADCRDARDLGLRLGLGRSTAVAMNNLADATGWFEGLREARKLWDEGIAFSYARGAIEQALWQRGERLRSLYHLGDWDELEREAADILSWLEEHGGGQLEPIARAHLANVLVHRGLLSRAAAEVDALLPAARDSGEPQVLVPGLAVGALVASAQEDLETVLERVTELERVTRGGAPTWRSVGLVWPVRLAIGHRDLAESFFEGSEHDSTWGRCARLGATAMIAEASGNIGEAAALFEQAAAEWERYGSVVEQGYALLGLGRCGNAKALREGNAIFAALGASPVLAEAA